MNIHIYYGSLTVFTEKLPNNYDSIVDLAIRDDEKHRKLKLDDGRDDADEELPYYENVVAFSDDYPALTESLIESFVSFIFRFDIDNLYLQNPPDSIAKHINELSSAEHSIERQDYKVLNMDMLREIKQEFPDAIIGQPVAQRQIIGTLYDVAKGRFNKPCVMLFYGNTGIGKTETAKYIAEKLNESCSASSFLCCIVRNLPRTYLVENTIKIALLRNFLSVNQMSFCWMSLISQTRFSTVLSISYLTKVFLQTKITL